MFVFVVKHFETLSLNSAPCWRQLRHLHMLPSGTVGNPGMIQMKRD